MKKVNYYIFILFFILSFSITSCKVERDIAREFVQQENTISILILSDSTLYKTNDKIKRIPDYDIMSEDLQDSIWTANTCYLDSVNDKKLIHSLYSKIKSELEYYEFHVYTLETKKAFDALNSEAYTFKISQIELEEDKYPYRHEYTFPHDSIVYYKDHELNKYDLNCWFELTPKDTSYDQRRVFYNSFDLDDKLDGIFFKNDSNKIRYKYHITPVSLNDIYYLSSYSGIKNANFLYNYFMNKYIRENMPTGFAADGYYSLDPNTGYIHYDDEENNENSFYEIE